MIKFLKINLFTPCPKGSKLIFFHPLGLGVKEENQLSTLLKKRIFFFIFIFISLAAFSQDTILIKGQFSAYTHINPDNTLPWWNGGRYIPQLNYEFNLPNNKLIDFEASANFYGNYGLKLSDSSNTEGDLKPYRLWGRYSTNQFEFRVGLQKINFGSASILRPLMWFDQVDPRDPLRLTDGVYGILARYYFLNNANIWLWGLYGNKNLKGWEILNSNKQIPEFGGRIQIPVPKGEAAFSYHHRIADGSIFSDSINTFGNVNENRLGFDAKFDVIIGCWAEATWLNVNENLGIFSNQEILNLGADYTFGLGNGLTVIYEHLIASTDEKAFEFKNTTTFSLFNITYPIGLFDNLSAIVYYDWINNKAYNFINWQKSFNKFSIYLMAYVNPKDYNIPTQETNEILYAGKGLQIMFVYNH